MPRISSGPVRFVAEALVILPALALGVVWALVTLAGLFHGTTVTRHRPEIEELMTLLLIVSVGCFTLGVLLFAASRGRRRPD